MCRKPKCLKRASASEEASNGATHAGAGPGDVEDDNCCACHMAAFRVIANSGAGDLEHFVADEDVVFLTFANDAFYRLVFAVVLDHLNQAVVVVVRGTMSFKVLLFVFSSSSSSSFSFSSSSSSSFSFSSSSLVSLRSCSLLIRNAIHTRKYATIYPEKVAAGRRGFPLICLMFRPRNGRGQMGGEGPGSYYKHYAVIFGPVPDETHSKNLLGQYFKYLQVTSISLYIVVYSTTVEPGFVPVL